MRLEHYSAKKIREDILKIVGKYLDLREYKIFFFGSRVNGKGSERSDIDVGIEGKKEIPEKILLKIREEIKNIPTLYHIDIVDFRKVDKDFYKVAKSRIEEVN